MYCQNDCLYEQIHQLFVESFMKVDMFSNMCVGFRKRKWSDTKSPKRTKRKQLVLNKRETDWVPQVDSDDSEKERGTAEVGKQVRI